MKRFACPHCGSESIGLLAKSTTGLWGPCKCLACGGLSRERRLARFSVSFLELAALAGVAFLPPGRPMWIGFLAWVAALVAVESLCAYRMPLVRVSPGWEKAKGIASWLVVIAVAAAMVLPVILTSR
jgi:hypothetical protein